MNDVQYAMLNAIKQAETKKLTLYPEDFEKSHIWLTICDCLGISYNSTEVHMEIVKVKTHEDD